MDLNNELEDKILKSQMINKLIDLQLNKYNKLNKLNKLTINELINQIKQLEKEINTLDDQVVDRNSSVDSVNSCNSVNVTPILERMSSKQDLLHRLSNSKLQPINKNNNDIEFIIIEADYSILIDDYSSSITSNVSPKISYTYPNSLSSYLSITNISNFCFPSGVLIDYLPTNYAMDTYINKSKDERHILQFIDGNGSASYACCVITYVGYTSPSIDITKVLIDISKRKTAANIIKNKLIKYLTIQRKNRWNNSVNTSSNQLDSQINDCKTPSRTNNFISKLFSNLRSNRLTNTTTKQSTDLTTNLTIDSSTHLTSSTVNTPYTNNHKKSIDKSSNNNTIENDVEEIIFPDKNLNNELERMIDSKMDSRFDNKVDSKIDTTFENELDSILDGGKIDSDINSDCKVDSKTSSIDSSNYEEIEEDEDDKNYEEILRMHRDYLIVSRRAYVMISKQPKHSMMFQILQAIADAERNLTIDTSCSSIQLHDQIVNSTSSSLMTTLSNSLSNSPSASLDENQLLNSSKKSKYLIDPLTMEKNRRMFLDVVVNYIDNNDYSKAVSHVDNKSSSQVVSKLVSKKTRGKYTTNEKIDIDRVVSVPGYIDKLVIHNSKYYPVLKEWTTAVLLMYLPTQMIVKLMSLLLTEKSLIVCGQQPGVVTAVTIAITYLIQPFEWEGVFVPLVPDDVRELFESPVPFITGTIYQPRMNEISSGTAVLMIEDITSNPTTCTSNYNAWFLSIPDMLVDIPIHESFIDNINNIKSNLLSNYTTKKIESYLVSYALDIYYTNYMSNQDKWLVNEFLQLINDNNIKYCYDITIYNNTSYISNYQMNQSNRCIDRFYWKKYIKNNIFQPYLFIEPLKSYVEFIDHIIYTQHFMSYVDKQFKRYLVIEDRYRLFIKDWIVFRRYLKYNNKSIR